MRASLAGILLFGALVVWAVWPMLTAKPTEEPIDWRALNEDELSGRVIQFEQENGLTLTGQIFVPDQYTAAAVIVHGSGVSDRANPFYRQLTLALFDKKIAVLLPDKRGTEGSQGDWRTSSFEELADDNTAALAKARQLWPDVPVSFVGMSQGSRIAPIAIARGADPDRLVAISGSVVPAHDQLTYEERNTLEDMGLRPSAASAIAPVTAWSIRALRQREFWERIGNIDPLPAWREVDMPALVLLGSHDRNVPVDRTVSRLRSLRQDNIEIAVFDGLGHSLAIPEENGIAPYVLDRITGFMSESSQVDAGKRVNSSD